jgi:hypothetical protein
MFAAIPAGFCPPSCLISDDICMPADRSINRLTPPLRLMHRRRLFDIYRRNPIERCGWMLPPVIPFGLADISLNGSHGLTCRQGRWLIFSWSAPN